MILKEIELFEGVDFEVMNEIAGICSEENYSKGTTIFERDEQAECLYILLEGTVYLVIKNGGSITYNLSEPGDVFGWSSMLENGKYTAAGVSATDLMVLTIVTYKLNGIFQNHPEVGFKVLQRLAEVISRRLSNAYRDLLSARSTDTTPSYG
ncbi:MAG: Crp/Fnr family transcriptional regulator [Gammaproteobacteria bacterium]|nr:Crp/Fnr family transcriptional regulator [Gammaproteobacteria bacterium]